MPKKAALPSAFTKRNEELRKKLNNLKRYIPMENTRLTLYGEIGYQCAKIAEEKGLKWYKNSKDTARSIRMFMLGTQDMSWDRMAVIDLFCADIEAARRVGIGERAGVPFTGKVPSHLLPPGPAHSDEPVATFPEPEQEPQKPAQAVTDDPEIAALYAIKDALDVLDVEARKRVLQWSAAKYNLEFAIVPVPHA